jgi:hypothetical protein
MTTRPDELDCLSLETLSSQVLEFGTRYKCSSLFGLIISDKEKKFYYIDTWCQLYKTFFLHH